VTISERPAFCFDTQMHVTATGIAIGLALWAGATAVFALLRPVEGRHVLTMQLALSLLRYDEGLTRLTEQSTRSATWWRDADPADGEVIDRALSMWDLAAWYVRTGRVDRRAVLDVFHWQIVDIWERAYPYILHRRTTQPTLWVSLTDLYVDAHAVSPRISAPALPADAVEEELALDVPAPDPTPVPVSVDLRPSADVPAADVPAADVPVAAAQDVPTDTDHWLEALREAIRTPTPGLRAGSAIRVDSPVPARPAADGRRPLSAATSEIIVDLVQPVGSRAR
jgi:hypothetical protein